MLPSGNFQEPSFSNLKKGGENCTTNYTESFVIPPLKGLIYINFILNIWCTPADELFN